MVIQNKNMIKDHFTLRYLLGSIADLSLQALIKVLQEAFRLLDII